MLISIVIPVYNEEKTILTVLERVKAVNLPFKKEIIVVDDGSTDQTRNILKNIERSTGQEIKVTFHEKRMGKGAALKSGFAGAKGDIVIIQDADLEYNPGEYPKLIKPILEDRADVVFGSRFLTGNSQGVLHFWHYAGNKFLTSLSNMFTNLNLTDMETCYKVFKKNILSQIDIKEKRFGFEPEITAKIAKIGCRFHEVGISYSRTYKEGKKINWKDVISAVRCIVKYWLFS